MLLLKMGPEVPSRALPALRRSEKEDGCGPSEFLVYFNSTIFVVEKKNQSYNSEHLQIELEGTPLILETNATFLGKVLDEHLTWEDHCNKVANKIAQNSGILKSNQKDCPNFLYENSFQFPYFPLLFLLS